MKHFYRVLPAQKGPLMVGKPKKENVPKMHFPGRGEGAGGGGECSEGHNSPSVGNLGAKSSEMSFPHFNTYVTRISHC